MQISIKVWVIGVLSLAIAIIIGSFVYNTKVAKQPATTPQKINPSLKQETIGQPTAKQFSFTSCDIKKTGNPIIHDIITEEDQIFGTFYGNINKISFDQAKERASIQLISPKGDQTYSFNVIDSKGLVYDSTTAKAFKFVDLKAGQTVMVSFNCFPKETGEKQFKIAQIMVTGK